MSKVRLVLVSEKVIISQRVTRKHTVSSGAFYLCLSMCSAEFLEYALGKAAVPLRSCLLHTAIPIAFHVNKL